MDLRPVPSDPVVRAPEVVLGELKDPPRLGAPIENPAVVAEQIGAQRRGAPIKGHELGEPAS